MLSGTASASDYADGHILVRFDPSKIGGPAARVRDIEKRDLVDTLNLPEGCDIIESKLARLERERSGRISPFHEPVNLARFVRVSVPDGMDPVSFSAMMNGRDDVVLAEPDGIGTGGFLPDDPSFSNQWFHNNSLYTLGPVPADIQSTNAWTITTGSSNVVVAVLDTGLYAASPDFSNRVVAGYDFVNNDSNPADDHNHGTMVAGVLAASGNNGALIAGVDWNCRIMPVKVLNSGNSGLYSDFADGIDFAVSNGADVINFSIGGSTDSAVLSNSIMNAIAEGVIFVTITHNFSTTPPRFPGRMEKCITVGATETNDAWASFSNYGAGIDISAPGRGITSINRFGTLNNNWFGTSFSCPMVAGAAALIKGLYPDITQEEMEAILCASADDEVGDFRDTEGWDSYHGWGRLNIYNALILARSRPSLGTDAGQLAVRWSSPPNASARRPFSVETALSPAGAWTTAAQPGDLTYSATQTLWHVTGTTTGGMFRVLTRPR